MHKQTAAVKQQERGHVSRRSSSASLVLSAASNANDGDPIARQTSTSSLYSGGSIQRQPSVMGNRARRPSLLGLPSSHVPSLHALPENDAYLGPPKPRSPQRTSSFLTSSGTTIRKKSLERETLFDTTMPMIAQSNVLDASLTGPEILEHSESLPVELLSSRARRPSILGLPGNDPYHGSSRAGSPRRTSSFLTSTGMTSRKGSSEREAHIDSTMPLLAQIHALKTSLAEPELSDHSVALPLELSRCSTSGSAEAATVSIQAAAPLVQVHVSVIAAIQSFLCAHAEPWVAQQSLTVINMSCHLLMLLQSLRSDCELMSQGSLSVPHLLVSHVFEEVLHMAAPSEGGRSTCEGVQDELEDVLMRTVNIISSFFEMLDLDKNGNVELADLQRMQVARYLCSQPFCMDLALATKSTNGALLYLLLTNLVW